MGVYISYIKKDSTINSANPIRNEGIDEILSLGSYNDESGTRVINRILIDPNTDDIISKIQEGQLTDYKVILDLKNTQVRQIPSELPVYFNPIKTRNNLDWINGVGHESDLPENNGGVSWLSITGNTGENWINTSGSIYPPGATGSYYTQIGGGTWYTGSQYLYSASINSLSTIDLSLDLTHYVNSVIDGDVEDKGVIVRIPKEYEEGSLNYTLNYFSKDTNTIFYPTVKLYYNDYEYTGSVVPVIADPNLQIKIKNSKTSYDNLLNKRFDLLVKPVNPTRMFTTSSIYLNNYKLPQGSLWSIEDYYTGEIIVPFDENYTKINSDNRGSYILTDFEVPYGRFYLIVIKTTVMGHEIIQRSAPFKIDRYG